MKQLLFNLLFCMISITTFNVPAFGQRVYEEDTIRLTREPIPSPVYYSAGGFTTVFNAPDLLKGEGLQPLLERYALLSGDNDSIFLNQILPETSDPQRFHTRVVLKRTMDELYRKGNIQLFDERGKQLSSILRFREEKVPVVGTNYYYAVGEKDNRTFEYFEVFIGCPAF
jgi:hypothetical protein